CTRSGGARGDRVFRSRRSVRIFHGRGLRGVADSTGASLARISRSNRRSCQRATRGQLGADAVSRWAAIGGVGADSKTRGGWTVAEQVSRPLQRAPHSPLG